MTPAADTREQAGVQLLGDDLDVRVVELPDQIVIVVNGRVDARAFHSIRSFVDYAGRRSEHVVIDASRATTTDLGREALEQLAAESATPVSLDLPTT